MIAKTSFLLFCAAALSTTSSQECTLCTRNNDVPNLTPAGSLFDPTGKIDCANLDTLRTQFTEDSLECTEIRLGAFHGGCCQFPPYELCDMCPDGTEPNNDKKIPTGAVTPPSCKEFEFDTFAYNPIDGELGSCSDIFLRNAAFYCDCPGAEQGCGICPESGGVMFPEPTKLSLRDNLLRNESCRTMVFSSSLYSKDQCTSSLAAFGVDYGAFCGCPGTAEQTDGCSICADGEKAKSGDTVIATAKGPDGVTRDIKCSEADELAKYITTDFTCELLTNRTRNACCSSAGVLKVISSFFVVGSAVVAMLL